MDQVIKKIITLNSIQDIVRIKFKIIMLMILNNMLSSATSTAWIKILNRDQKILPIMVR